MAKEVIVDVKVKVANAKGQLDELNKSLSASEDLISDLEQELEKLNDELENSNGVTNEQINAQVKLAKQIEDLENKVKTLESIISFYLYETGSNNQTLQ